MDLVTCWIQPSERLMEQAEDPTSHVTSDMLMAGERKFLDVPRAGDSIQDSQGGTWVVQHVMWPEEPTALPVLVVD